MVKTSNKSALLFNPIPVRVDIIGPSNTLLQSIYILGDQPSKIATDVKSKGVDALKDIFPQKVFIGGDAEIDWDDIDDEDFEMIINSDEPIDQLTHATNQNQTNDTITAHDIKSKPDKFLYDLVVYKEDTVYDLQKKIAIISGVHPLVQYISMDSKCLTHHLSMHGSFNSNTIDWLDLEEFMNTSTEQIKDVPVDSNYISFKASTSIIDTRSVILESISKDYLHVKMLALGNIITNRSGLMYMLKTDRQSFDTIFDSTINKFFPFLQISQFVNFLSDKPLSTEDNESIFNLDKYKSRSNKRIALINDINAIPQVSTETSDITIVTRTMSIKSKSAYVPMLSLQLLFNSILLSKYPSVFFVDLFLQDGSRFTQLRKISKYSGLAVNILEGVNMQVRLTTATSRRYKSKNIIAITMLPTTQFQKLMIFIDEYGMVEIDAFSNLSNGITKNKFKQEITQLVNSTILQLNKETKAFETLQRLDENLAKYDIAKATSSIIFKHQYDYQNTLQCLVDYMNLTQFMEIQINTSNLNLKTRNFNINRTYNLFGETDDVQKEFVINSNGAIAMFAFSGLDTNETAFYIDWLGRFVEFYKGKISAFQNKENGKETSLGSIDPVLFKYSSERNNYARICQKKFQPVTAKETDKGVFKYHNFTFNTPQYYKCPNSNMPHVGLISGYHPNGYCLPCCRKVEQDKRDDILSKCISGDDMSEEPASSKNKKDTKNYIIEYVNDLVENQKLFGRLVDLPKFINKILSKGVLIRLNGRYLDYLPKQRNYQMISLLSSYLGYKSHRDLVLDMINHIKQSQYTIMHMPAVALSFLSVEELITEFSSTMLKQSVVESQKNWNDIVVDIAISMGTNIAILSDNRAKAVECSNMASKEEECSLDITNTNNSTIKLQRLEYINFQQPIVMFFKRLDVEYSKVNTNRRYDYFTIECSDHASDHGEPTPLSQEVAEQLQTISGKLLASTSLHTSKCFSYVSLIKALPKTAKATKYIKDINGNISYLEASISNKTILMSLYPFPLDDTNIKALLPKDTNPTTLSGSIDDIFKIVETHNLSCIIEPLDDFHTYLNINVEALTNHRMISLPESSEFFLKLDHGIIYNGKIIGLKFFAIKGKDIVHAVVAYHKPTDIKELTTLYQLTDAKIRAMKSPTIASTKWYLGSPIDTIKRSQRMFDEECLLTYQIDPRGLIGYIPKPKPFKDSKEVAYIAYTSRIYPILVDAVIKYWKQSKPTKLLSMIEKLIKETKPEVLKSMSEILLSNWAEKLLDMLPPGTYRYELIYTELEEFSAFVMINDTTRSKETIIKILHMDDNPINDIDLHNLAFMRPAAIKVMVEEAIKGCTKNLKDIPMLASKDESPKDWYKDTNGDVLMYEPIKAQLQEQIVADLSNPFRREYLMTNSMFKQILNTMKLTPHLDELIYIQQL